MIVITVCMHVHCTFSIFVHTVDPSIMQKFFFQIDTLGRLFFRVLMFDISADWSKTQNVVPANISHNNAL